MLTKIFSLIKFFIADSLLNEKQTIKLIDPRTLCTKESFGYLVAHHGTEHNRIPFNVMSRTFLLENYLLN